MLDFPIVDAHVHLWDTRKLLYPWLEPLPTLKRSFLLEDYDRACGAVDVQAMVFMQCEVDRDQAKAEVDWVLEIAEAEPRIKAVVPWAPVEDGERNRTLFREYRRHNLIKGIRRLIQSEADPDFCLQPQFLRGLQILPEYGFSFDICISHTQMSNVLTMVERCPETSFILDHLGKPDIRRRITEPWKAELKDLSKFPNVVCKLSGMLTETDVQNWTREDLKPYIDHVLDCFGSDRILFGGDWPVVTLAGEYRQWMEVLEWALQGFSAQDIRKIFRDNAGRVYRIGESS